jgi:H+/gluconate symporter-like permease
MSVVQTLKSWSVLESILSVTGLVLVLAASFLT